MNITKNLLNKSIDELKELNFKNVVVKYKDRSRKSFTIEEFYVFKKGIIENLFSKGLCKIKFKK